MNDQLSFQSSVLCEDVATSTLTSASAGSLDHSAADRISQVTHMASHSIVNKKLMLLMALCLVFATAVPVIVLAAG